MEKLNNGRKNIAKYKYWSELPATKHSFFLFMWHGFQTEMVRKKSLHTFLVFLCLICFHAVKCNIILICYFVTLYIL